MSRSTVLIADDKENVLALLRDVLLPAYKVETANDGRHALSRALDGGIDVVVADIRMPDLDGFQLLSELKRSRPEIEVVLMTAYGGVESAIEAIRAGAFDYVTKPFEPEQLLSKIQRAVGSRKVAQQTKLSKLSYKDAMEAAHDLACRAYLQDLLEEFKGNVSHAAERAQIERESLHRLLKRYGLASRAFRRSS
ncbi:MAG TPA: response regulator [Polyangiaceae bacterium]|nr:response regulator [Polyangiaceae bacterium]